MSVRSMRVASGLVGLAAAAYLSACSADITGPIPEVSGVAPEVVCQAQISTWVNVAGSSMSPLPTDGLTDEPLLVLPSMDLTRTFDIDGLALDDSTTVRIPDEPVAPDESHVRWQAEASMDFDVYPELALETGLYSLTVGNANGSSAELPDSLLAVPPPTVSGIVPDILCGDMDNTLTVNGDFFLRYPNGNQPTVAFGDTATLPVASMSNCRALPGPSGVEACTTVTVDIPADTLGTAGELYAHFDVRVHNPETAPCVSEEPRILTIVPEPVLESVVPDLLCVEQGDNQLALNGVGFVVIDGATPELEIGGAFFTTSNVDGSCVPIPGPMETVSSCTQLTATVAQNALGTGPDTHPVVVTNPPPVECFSIDLVNLHVEPPPVVDSIEPDLVCVADGSREVVIRGQRFLGIRETGAGEMLPSILVRDPLGVLPDLTPASSVDPSATCEPIEGLVETVRRCDALRITIPATFASGNFEVYATNPTPSVQTLADGTLPPPPYACESGPGALYVVNPPDVLAVVPDLVCVEQGGRPVIIEGTGFLVIDGAVPSVEVAGIAPVATPGDCAAYDPTPLGAPAEIVQVCGTLAVVIPDTVAAGAYELSVTNPQPAGCSDPLADAVTVVPAPVIDSVTPAGTCLNDKDATFVVSGSGFLVVDGITPLFALDDGTLTASASPLASDVTGCTPVAGPAESVSSCTSFTVTVPRQPAGRTTFLASVQNPLPAGCVAPFGGAAQFQVENLPLPVITDPSTASPITICQGGDTFTITGTNIWENATVTLVDPDGSGTETSDALTPISCNPATGLCTEVEISFGALPDTFISPPNLDLLVENGAGCGVTQLAAVEVTSGPLILYSDPPIVYDGIPNTLTVYAAKFVTSGVEWVRLIAHSDGTEIVLCDDGTGNPCISNLRSTGSNPANGVFNVTVPAGTLAAVGGAPTDETFDMVVKTNALPCTAQLLSATRILSVPEADRMVVTPNFGKVGEETDVTIASPTAPFVATPRAFVSNPVSGSGAPLLAVTFVDGDTLNAIVPDTLTLSCPPPCFQDLDLIVITPDGRLFVEENAVRPPGNPVFRLSDFDPPRIDDISPGQLPANSIASVQVTGVGFSGDGSDARGAPTATLSCSDALGNPLTGAQPTVSGLTVNNSTSLTLSIDPQGFADVVCTVRITNDAVVGDGAVDTFSALVFANSSGNIPAPRPTGVALTEPRAGAAVEVVGATRASRFMWVVGGDAGSPATAKDTFERAVVRLDGSLGAFEQPATYAQAHRRYTLGTPRTSFGLLNVGRALYAIGGANGANAALATVERAMVLDPTEVIDLDIDDFDFGDAANPGLDPGGWIYRSTVVFGPGDPIHPCGESLPSEPFVMNAPSIDDGVRLNLRITLGWDTPDTSLPGTRWSNREIAGYRLYRTPVVNGSINDLAWYAEVPSGGPGIDTFEDPVDARYTDIGCGIGQAEVSGYLPPAIGETTKWVTVDGSNALHPLDLSLQAARAGSGFRAVEDKGSSKVFLYAMSGAGTGGAGLNDYELLVIDHDPATNPTEWETSGWARTTNILMNAGGSCGGPNPRVDAGLFLFEEESSSIDGVTFEITTDDQFLIYAPGRLPAGGAVGSFESWRIAPVTGVLQTGVNADAKCNASAGSSGYGTIGVNAQVFTFGGSSGTASIRAVAWESQAGPKISIGTNSYSDNGAGMTGPRYRHASILDRAFIYLIAGENDTGVILDTIEFGIW